MLEPDVPLLRLYSDAVYVYFPRRRCAGDGGWMCDCLIFYERHVMCHHEVFASNSFLETIQRNQ